MRSVFIFVLCLTTASSLIDCRLHPDQSVEYDGYQLSSVSGPDIDLSFVHDGDGRVTAIDRPGTEDDLNLQYDDFNQLTRVADTADQTVVRVGHDALGRSTQVEGDTDKDVLVANTGWNFESPLLAISPQDFAAWAYAGDMPLMRLTSSGAVYYLQDAGGSVIGLVDNAGQKNLLSYDSFGKLLIPDNSLTLVPSFLDGDLGFQGGWFDPDTDLIQFRARANDPTTGLFLSRDRGDVVESEIESFNLFQFAFGKQTTASGAPGLDHYDVAHGSSLAMDLAIGAIEFERTRSREGDA